MTRTTLSTLCVLLLTVALGSLDVAAELSRPGASFAVKLFQGAEFEAVVERVRRAYRRARVAVPKATRPESREAYLLGFDRWV